MLCIQQEESPVLIRSFPKNITKPGLFAVLTGGFAGIAGSAVWEFAAYGVRLTDLEKG